MLLVAYNSQNYAGIIYLSLDMGMEVCVSVHTNLSILYILFGCWGPRMEALLYIVRGSYRERPCGSWGDWSVWEHSW